MDNNYFTNVNPYFAQQDQGLSPVFQNIAQQQQNQNAALAQQNQLVQQAGQTNQQGGMSPMMMAQMLRKQDPNKPAPVTDYSQPMPNYMDPAYKEAMY
jgi:hypothetical protein